MPVPILPALPGSLDAHFPVLLLPVIVQVKFVEPAPGTYELRVRIYPDQLGISTHEAALTEAEQAAGAQYWALAPDALSATGLHDLAHWRALVARFGVPRSRWILRQTVPADYRDQVPNLPVEPMLPAATTRWTRAAEAPGLPHHFSVLLYAKAAALSEVAEGPVKNLLYAAARPYDAPAVPRPTTEFLRLAKVAEGNPVTQQGLPVGLDPKVDHDATDIGGVDAGNKWTVDFDEAVTKGMALRVALSQTEYAQGFARLVVLGVRTDGAAAGQQALATLLTDHCYTDGLHLVAQGTPTNNTDAVAAGYSSRERTDAEGSFDLLAQPASFAASTLWAERPDGQHLASALGLADGAMPPLAGAGAGDTREAQALNRALWPATYGYFLEEMLRPLLSFDALAWTRTFFENYVLARGVAPALRVGAQPYGVLPTTRFSVWEVDANHPNHVYATQLQGVLAQLDAVWTERLNPQNGLYPGQVTAGSAKATFSGPPTDRTNLLTTLGLNATSTEYYHRYLIGPIMAEALNADALAGGTGDPEPIWADAARANGHYDPTQNPLYQEFARLLDPANAAGLQGPVGSPTAAPPIFGYTFQSTLLKLADAFADEPGKRRKEGVLIDDEPLSETEPVAPPRSTTASRAYINWLATTSFDNIRLENFTGLVAANPQLTGPFVPPNSLFYYLLRQAVLLEYWSAAKAYFVAHGPTLTPSELADDELFNILITNEKPRWAWLYDIVNGQKLHEELRATGTPLADYLTGVAQLANLPTARLERLVAEHLDLGSYRLDAWRLAPVAERLAALRQTSPTGSHLGAFGWLEDLKPTDHSVPNADGTRDDPDNLGYIHAPSPTHGTAAAILRQGYKSRQLAADAADPTARRMAVDLSSRRVRAALALLEGLRAGLSLGTLLGQSFERALQQHDGLARNGHLYGSFVGAFRAAFPLADEHAPAPGAGQAVAQGLPPEHAARQVTDGAALLRAAAAPRNTYPYGVGMPSAATDPALAAFVVGQVAQLTDDLDALGDLAVSEGIFQAARGNTDRAAAVLESVAKGQFAVQPDIVLPPQRSLTLTQRVLVQLPAAATLQNWPTAPTPRAAAAPRLNAWLAQFFPDPNDLSFAVGYRLGTSEWVPQNAATATLFALRLQPIDLLYLLDEKALQEHSPLDQLLVYAVGQSTAIPSTGALPDDARLAINYELSTGVADLRRLLPLLARLRQLVGGTRPARLRDLQAPGSLTDSNQDAGLDHNDLIARLTASQTALTSLAPTPPDTTALTLADFYQAALFGIAEAFPALAPGADLNSATLAVRQAVRTRLAAAAVALRPIAPATAITVAASLEQAAALFGPAFRPDVLFAFDDPAAKKQYEIATSAATAADLLRHHAAPPLALLEWVHGLGAVREPMNQLDKVLLIQNLLYPDADAPMPLRPAQFSAAPPVPNQPDYWLGLSWPRTYSPPGDALSLVQWLPDAYDATEPQCALWLDEWTETLPQATPAASATPQGPPQGPPQGTQSTALAFHYDQPNSEAPQAMLLVVSPRSNPTTWTIDDLLGAVNETLDLAKKRTVEPDALAFTPLATVLPAVVAPVAQQAVTFTLDLGRTTGTVSFNEEPLLL